MATLKIDNPDVAKALHAASIIDDAQYHTILRSIEATKGKGDRDAALALCYPQVKAIVQEFVQLPIVVGAPPEKGGAPWQGWSSTLPVELDGQKYSVLVRVTKK